MRTPTTPLLVLAAALILIHIASAQPAKLTFKRISTEIGLPSSRVNAIAQTRDGIIWFGTREGFCMYENGAVTVYQPDAGDQRTLSNNDVRVIYEDRAGIVWIGVFGGGIYRFDRASGRLTQFRHNPSNANSLSDDRVLSILEDRDGTLWIGTVNGLNIYDRNTMNFSLITYDPDNPYSLSESRVWPLAEDRTGNLWIGTLGGGLNKLEKSTGTIQVFRNEGTANSVAGNSITALLTDKSGALWVGTENSGLSKFVHERDEFDRERQEFRQYLHGMNITSLAEDLSGNIIVGTAGSGLKIIERNGGTATTVANDPNDPKSLSDNNVRCVFVDNTGLLWVGTENGGVCVTAQEDPQRTRRPRRVFN